MLSENKLTLLQQEHPGVTDITLASRDFSDYNECISSCRRLMDDLCVKANSAVSNELYKVSTEINPVHSGAATLSKDWSASELARIWVYDKNMEVRGQLIQAIGQARIFKTKSVAPLLN